jgi:hypothetical protein
MAEAEVYMVTDHCIFASTRDPAVRERALISPDVLPGSEVIVPIVRRRGVFELTAAEWADTRELLR